MDCLREPVTSFSPAQGQVTLEALSYDSFVNLGARTITFELMWNRPPDFFTLDSVGRQADAFAYYFDTRPGVDALLTFFGDGPPGGVQSRIWTLDIPSNGMLSVMGPQPGAVPYTLNGSDLSFTVPFQMLGEEDGQFSYRFELYEYGGWTGVTYGPVPEPSTMVLSTLGLMISAIALRRRTRR
jgi:hypothetical protein